MMTKKICLVSLGCAKNLVNSEQMLYLLTQSGHEIVAAADEADIAIVNTCGFIDSAAQEAIDHILELAVLKTEGSLEKIVVTGCLSERYKDEILKELPEVDAVIGCGSYNDIADVVEEIYDFATVTRYGDIDAHIEEVPRILATPAYMAYIKIAEGCDNRCAYCVIPSLRGKYRSRKMENIIAEAQELANFGIRELIIVAQDTTRYGIDIYGKRMLPELLERLCEIKDFEWIRLHYLYPDELDDKLIETVKNQNKVVNYFDLPIQHINDNILKAMNRRGTKSDILSLIKKIRTEIPDAVIRTSIICGLPGEGENEFNELCEFLREYKLERAGIFKFSPQEGTKAAEMDDIPDEDTAQWRMNFLLDIQSEVIDEYNESCVGKTMTILCEGMDEESGMYVGRSYADSPDIDGRVLFSSENGFVPGEMCKVLITGAIDGELNGIVE